MKQIFQILTKGIYTNRYVIFETTNINYYERLLKKISSPKSNFLIIDTNIGVLQ